MNVIKKGEQKSNYIAVNSSNWLIAINNFPAKKRVESTKKTKNPK